jgi:hypothetical protein
MESWILAAVVLAVLGIGSVTRLRRSRRANAQKDEKNIYPLW